MKIFLNSLVVFFTTLPILNAQNFIELSNGTEIYLRHRPATMDQNTLVLLNGLTYDLHHWDDFISRIDSNAGVVSYDMRGQGETLKNADLPSEAITMSQQVEDLREILELLPLTKPVVLAGLSYGGGIAIAFAAKYPEKVKAIALMAPFTIAVDFQDTWIRQQIDFTRLLQPWNLATDDELYDYFLHVLVYTTFPQAEPGLLEHPWKLEAAFQMVRGIRKFEANNITWKPFPTDVHLLVATRDRYIKPEVLDSFWESVPQRNRAAKLLIHGASHKIPESTPNFASSWLNLILREDSRLMSGQIFDGDPIGGLAVSKDFKIDLPSDSL